MKKIKIQIADKIYTVELAESEQEHEEGLQEREKLKEDEGMLFVFPEDDEKSFWMKDTDIPLDIIFINEDLGVTSVGKGIPNSLEYITGEGSYVLELNKDSGVKKGDELEFNPSNKKVSDKMLVLGSDGTPQYKLDGGERIVSRKETVVLIRKAKKAATLESEGSYKSLGKYFFKVLDGQSKREPEYVESKN